MVFELNHKIPSKSISMYFPFPNLNYILCCFIWDKKCHMYQIVCGRLWNRRPGHSNCIVKICGWSNWTFKVDYTIAAGVYRKRIICSYVNFLGKFDWHNILNLTRKTRFHFMELLFLLFLALSMELCLY